MEDDYCYDDLGPDLDELDVLSDEEGITLAVEKLLEYLDSGNVACSGRLIQAGSVVFQGAVVVLTHAGAYTIKVAIKERADGLRVARALGSEPWGSALVLRTNDDKWARVKASAVDQVVSGVIWRPADKLFDAAVAEKPRVSRAEQLSGVVELMAIK